MKIKELYNYIISQMTPEEALMKLLESSLITYDKLKFPVSGEEIHPLIIITMASMDMGWQIAVENADGEVRGLSVGTEDFMKDLYKLSQK